MLLNYLKSKILSKKEKLTFPRSNKKRNSKFENLKQMDSIFSQKLKYKEKIKHKIILRTLSFKNSSDDWRKIFHTSILILKLLMNIFGVFFTPMRFLLTCDHQIHILIKMELLLSLFYSIELFYDFYSSATNIFNFLMSVRTILDILNILPGFINCIIPSNNKYIHFLGVLKSWRIFRFFDLIYKLKFNQEKFNLSINQDRIYESLQKENNIKVEIYKVITHLICLIYTSTNFIVEIQEIYDGKVFILPNGQTGKLNYPQTMYFIIVTLTTLGYGDITPANSIFRIFITILLISYIGIISRDLTILSDSLKIFSPYDKNYYHLKNHIVILGYFNPLLIKNMVLNFYAEVSQFVEDRSEIKFLIVSNEDPSSEMLSILGDFTLMGYIKYLKSNLFEVKSNSWMKKS